MAEVRNKYEGMSKEELAREKRVLESMIYAEKQKIIHKGAEDLWRRHADYLRTLNYNLSQLKKAEHQLEQRTKPPLAQVILKASKQSSTPKGAQSIPPRLPQEPEK